MFTIMSKGGRLSSLMNLALGAVMIGSFSTNASAQETGKPVTIKLDTSTQLQSGRSGFWTAERMKNAKPAPTPKADSQQGTVIPNRTLNQPADAFPTLYPGWNPKSGKPQPGKKDVKVFKPSDTALQSTIVHSRQAFGSPPSHPVDYANYGKFQRWTWFGKYTTYPTSTIGKMFYTYDGQNVFSCSGTVVNRNMFITAGHCVSDGFGTGISAAIFCPSYNANGVNPSVGCWDATSYSVSNGYHLSNDIDRDYACVVTSSTGDVHNTSMGNVTGWAGLAVNYGSDEMVFATGYPSEPPFQGFNIVYTAASEWYAINRTPGHSAVTKFIGSDMTRGSSGGGWLIGLAHPNSTREIVPVDSSNITDPLSSTSDGPYVNGVNSHRRCLESCDLTPSSTGGSFINEMGSPSFTSSGADTDDVQDIYNLCLANGGD